MKAKRLLLSFWVLVLLAGTGCTDDSGQSQSSQDSTQVGRNMQASLRLGWIPSGSFAGEVAGMTRFASEHSLNLNVEAGGQGLNPTTLVQNGEDTFGTLAASEVLAANEKGANLVIIGVINYFSPGGFVSLAKENITEPKDFEGKTVGMLPFGSTTLLYRSLLRENNVDRSKVKEITVSPELRPFIQGNYEVHPVFVYDETVTLDQRGIEYNLIEPNKFGVTLKGPVYFTKQSTLKENPELVEAFVKTMADGWNYALENQEQVIQMLKEFAPEIDKEREEKVLAKGADYFRAYKGQPVNSDVESWSSMVEELQNLDVIEGEVNLEKALELSFIHDYYTRTDSTQVDSSAVAPR